LIVILGVFVSSIRYSVLRDGRAIKINRNAGRIVQIVSISCPSIINLLKFFPKVMEVTRYRVKIVIKIKIIMAWSWKNKMCSIDIDTLSWRDSAIQLGIILNLEEWFG